MATGKSIAGSLSQRVFPLLAVCGLLSLSACGFHLRGSEISRVQLPPTYLAGAPGPLQQEVRHYLNVSGVAMVEEQKDAQLVIDLIGEKTQRRVQSVGSTGKVEEYEVQYRATYAVTRGNGESLIPPETLSQRRSYSFNEADVLAKDTEQDRLVQDMRRDVVRQMMLRLQSVLKRSP
ncbi:MAG: LPS assembly lipoprotein LptE [Gammaproteobacteria bacterium]